MAGLKISYSQTNYYVKTTGNDSNTGLSPSLAWQTIQKAANEMQAGDTVFIMSGTYEEIVIPSNSGTRNSYITYTSYQEDTVIIDGTHFASTYLKYSDRGIFDIKDKYYINVIGLQVQNSAAGGIMCRYGSSNINIKYNRIYNCNATGIGTGYSRDSDTPLATNIVAQGNILDSCSLTDRESLSFRSIDTFEIFDNTVRNTPKEAIDAKSGCSNGIIHHNFVSNAEAVGIYLDAGIPDSLYLSQNNIQVYQNLVINSKNSIVVSSEAGCLGENIQIFNNVIYDNNTNGQNGILIANFGESGPLQNILIINNTIYSKGHRGIYINNQNVNNIYIRNNICSQNSICQIDVNSSLIDSVYLDHNLIDGYTEDFGNSFVVGNPGFQNSSTSDFQLDISSLAIDNGSANDAPSIDYSGLPRPSGSGFDIGAFEYIFPNSSDNKINEGEIICFPNPTTGIINIIAEKISKIEVYNSLGQKINEINNPENSNIINLTGENGIYLIISTINDKKIANKVVLR